MNEVVAFNNLLSLRKVFDSLCIEFWLDEGTALGAWRGNQFIENEGDIDVGFFSESVHLMPHIMDELKREGWGYFHLNEHPSGEGKQLSCIRQGISVDISVYYLRGDKRWRCMFDLAPGRAINETRYFACVYPKRIFDQLEEIDFLDYGVKFKVPPKEFLRLQYGDWEKPDPNFRWQWDYKSMDLKWEFI
jgi:hypothetical protein